ncbi:MAG: hypothetical protein AAF581_10905 [Planctomycetota bacterium]
MNPFRITALALLVLFGLVGATSCSKPAPVVVDEEPELTVEEMEAERERQRLARLSDRTLKMRKRLRNAKASQIDRNLFQDLQALLISTQGTKYENDALSMMNQSKERFQTKAQNELDAVLARVNALMEDGDFVGADEELFKFPEAYHHVPWSVGTREPTDALKEWGKKQEEIKLFDRASTHADTVMSRAAGLKNQGTLEGIIAAIAILESYHDRYKNTKHYPEVREMIERYLPIYEELKAEAAPPPDIAWVEMGVEGLIPHGPTELFKELESGYEVENKTESPVQIVGGEKEWIDYTMECDVRIDSGQKLLIGMSAGFSRGQYGYKPIRVPIRTGEWVRLRVQVRKGKFEIYDLDEGEILDEGRTAFPEGNFAVFALPAETIALKKVRYQLYRSTKDAAAEDSGGGGDQEDGNG